MMDFRTPERDRYRNYKPHRQPPQAAAPRPEHHQTPEPQPAAAVHPKRSKAGSRSIFGNMLKITIGLALLALIVWLVHGYIDTRNQLEQARNTPASNSGSQTDQLIGKIGQLVDLPQGETPTIATVNDASKLKNQQFFASAKDGDKVLIFSKAGKAVLYRPSTNKVIDYSTVNLGSTPTR